MFQIYEPPGEHTSLITTNFIVTFKNLEETPNGSAACFQKKVVGEFRC